jgi:hypothetical protein
MVAFVHWTIDELNIVGYFVTSVFGAQGLRDKR